MINKAIISDKWIGKIIILFFILLLVLIITIAFTYLLVSIEKKEKHFVITEVEFDEDQRVTKCVIEAAMTQNEYEINWRELKEPKQWKVGWQ